MQERKKKTHKTIDMKNKNGILTDRPKYNHIKNYMKAKGLKCINPNYKRHIKHKDTIKCKKIKKNNMQTVRES